MSGNAPRNELPNPGEVKNMFELVIQGLSADPEDYAGTEWQAHLKKAKLSHLALQELLKFTPEEVLWRLRNNSANRSWRTISTGSYHSAEHMFEAFVKSAQGSDCDQTIGKMLQKTGVTKSPTVVSLAQVSRSELGMELLDWDKFCREIVMTFGYSYCQAEDAVEFYLQYPSRANASHYHYGFGMNPVKLNGDHRLVEIMKNKWDWQECWTRPVYAAKCFPGGAPFDWGPDIILFRSS